MFTLQSLFRGFREGQRHRRAYAETLTAYEDVFASIFNELHDPEVSPSQRMKLSIRWCRRNAFDATASMNWRNRRQIIIDQSCYYLLQGHANNLFRHPDFLSQIGEPQKVTPFSAACDEDAPACPIRFQAACGVTEIALGLIFLHELAHHAFSHVGGGVRALHEAAEGDAPVAAAGAMAFQIDEIQADRFAFGTAAALAHSGAPLFDQQILGPELRHAFLPELTIAAQALVVGLLGGLDDAVNERDERAHPHPAVRMISAISFLSQNGPIHVEDRDRLQALYLLAMNIFATFTSGARAQALFLDESAPLRERAIRLISGGHPRSAARKRYSFKTGQFE